MNPKYCLLGAIAGDVIGSVYEYNSQKREDFELLTPASAYTDDTVLTVAVADAILRGGDYRGVILEYARRYPDADYGGGFQSWLRSPDPQPYNSFGNGSAMRVSPVGWAFETEEDVLKQAELSAAPTHNHLEGIKGAQATALAIFLARRGATKPEIREAIEARFGYDLSEPVESIRRRYRYDVTCQGTVPPALRAFLESEGFEDAIRKTISLGGDADTLAAITGAVAEAFYGGVPEEIAREVRQRLPQVFWRVVEDFSARYA